MKLIKFCVIFLLTLGMALLGILTLGVEPLVRRWQPEIISGISNAIGQPLSIDDISFNVFPYPALKLTNVRLSGGSSEGEQIGELYLAAELSPLIHGKLVFTSLEIDQAVIALVKKSDGQLYISGIPLARKEGGPAEKKESRVGWAVDWAGIRNASLNYRDDSLAGVPKVNLVVDQATVTQTASDKELLFILKGHLPEPQIREIQSSGKINLANFDPQKLSFNIAVSADGLDSSGLLRLAQTYGLAQGVESTGETTLKLKASGGIENLSIAAQLDLSSAAINVPGKFKKAAGVSFLADIPMQVAFSFIGQEQLSVSSLAIAPLKVVLGDQSATIPVDYKAEDGLRMGLNSSGLNLAILREQIPALKGLGLSSQFCPALSVSAPQFDLAKPANYDWQKVSLDLFVSTNNLDMGEVVKLARTFGSVQEIESAGIASLNLKAKGMLSNLDLNADLDLSKASLRIPNEFEKQAGLKLIGQGAGKLVLGANNQKLPVLKSIVMEKLNLTLGEQSAVVPIRYMANDTVRIGINSSKLDLAKLRESVLALKQIGLSGTLRPDLTLLFLLREPNSTPELTGNLGLEHLLLPRTNEEPPFVDDISGALTFQNSKILVVAQCLLSGKPIDVNSEIQLKADQYLTPQTVIRGFNGQFDFSGSMQRSAPKGLAGSYHAQNLSVAPTLAALNLALPFDGTMQSLEGQLAMQVDNPATTYTTSLKTVLVSGRINGVNIVGSVLSELGKVAVFAGQGLIPESVANVLTANATEFDTLSFSVEADPNQMKVENIDLKYTLYNIVGSGVRYADGTSQFNLQLQFGADLIDKLSAHNKLFALLLSPGKLLVIPVIVRRDGPIFYVIPDLKEALKRVFAVVGPGAIKEGAKTIIGETSKGISEAYKGARSLFGKE